MGWYTASPSCLCWNQRGILQLCSNLALPPHYLCQRELKAAWSLSFPHPCQLYPGKKSKSQVHHSFHSCLSFWGRMILFSEVKGIIEFHSERTNHFCSYLAEGQSLWLLFKILLYPIYTAICLLPKCSFFSWWPIWLQTPIKIRGWTGIHMLCLNTH